METFISDIRYCYMHLKIQLIGKAILNSHAPNKEVKINEVKMLQNLSRN
jgi:hypothetical protein